MEMQPISQCRYGSAFKKFAHLLGTASLKNRLGGGNHECREGKNPPGGHSVRGKFLAVPVVAWQSLQSEARAGAFLTRDAATHPKALDEALAQAVLSKAAAKDISQGSCAEIESQLTRRGAWGNMLVRTHSREAANATIRRWAPAMLSF